MSVADIYLKKCQDAIDENVALLLNKLSDPSSLVDVNLTGALAEVSSLGDLEDLAGDYVSNNAGALTMAVLGAAGLQNSVLGGLNLFFNLLAGAASAYNDIILLLMKQMAQQIKAKLQSKIDENTKVRGDLLALVNTLTSMNNGDAVFEAYLTQLRAALILINQGRTSVQLTRNTLQAQDTFLTKTFRGGRKKFTEAQKLIKPLANNPYTKPTLQSLALNLGIPDTPQQIGNILALPKLCKKVIDDSKNYGTFTMEANTLLVLYFDGLEVLQTSLPDILKQQVIKLFDQVLAQIRSLQTGMGKTLNGAPGAVFGPVRGYTPQPLNVSVNAFKWMMDINLIVNGLKTIPADVTVIQPQSNGKLTPTTPNTLIAGAEGQFAPVGLGDTVTITGGKFAIPGDYIVMKKVLGNSALVLDRNAYTRVGVHVGVGENTSPGDVQYSVITDGALAKFQLNQDLVKVYTDSVARIKKKGNRSSGTGFLLANQGQENFAEFQARLVTFMAEVMLSIPSAKARTATISEGIALAAHCDLSIQQDTEIIAILQKFIDTPIPLEETLNQILTGLKKVLGDLGLDKAADAFANGDFKSLFKMNGKNATYIGAALEALALLKSCFPNLADLNNFLKTENSLKGEQDLLNIKVTFNFDLAILKNLAACVDFSAFASLFQTKEFLCGLSSAAGVAAQSAGAAVAGEASLAAGAISSGVDSAFSGLSDLLTFPDTPPPADSVPPPPSNVVTDTAAVALAAKTA